MCASKSSFFNNMCLAGREGPRASRLLHARSGSIPGQQSRPHFNSQKVSIMRAAGWVLCCLLAGVAAANVETLIDMSHSDSHYAFFHQVAAGPKEGLFFSDTRGHCIRKWTQQGAFFFLRGCIHLCTAAHLTSNCMCRGPAGLCRAVRAERQPRRRRSRSTIQPPQGPVRQPAGAPGGRGRRQRLPPQRQHDRYCLFLSGKVL